MRLVDRNGQYIIYSDNKDYLMEYALVIGESYLSSQGRVTGCEYLFIMDQRYDNVVGAIRCPEKEFETRRTEVLAKIKSKIEYYEKNNWNEDNYLGIDLEEFKCEF